MRNFSSIIFTSFNSANGLVYFYSNETPVPAEHFFELYDLKNDPHEMRNIYGTPEAGKQTTRLMKELKRLASYYNEVLPPCPELENL